MRYLTYIENGQTPKVGVLLSDSLHVLDLSHESLRDMIGNERPSLLEMIKVGLPSLTKKIKGKLESGQYEQGAVVSIKAVSLCSPIPNPGKVVGAAYNFTDALDERSMPYPSEPVIFIRSGNTVIGPHDPILIPPDVGNVGYEAELAVIIGKRALFIEPKDAMECIVGYTVHNDVSGSGMIKEDGGNFVRGKNMPASAPFGPYLVTADEVENPYAIQIKLDVDGRVLQDGTTGTMLFKIAELISYISKQMPLEPGDIIATGTPAGLAMMHQPPAWLEPGQTVRVELEGLGALNNPIKKGVPLLE
ncbi:fumarylacetoacetate hydrolase family protein [Polynucleobacter sp. MWH-Braz-FAM2G]|uniref:fumarylacetoacetate hydrolase family protein n=1 Tax=Polynucleobacter sp. MWH-Braz-FAM2G TaxID=1855883 RepID=UPI001BFD6F18|nr:fumarylacetoacetate hydrolase family protein [Polynucleobacter sp. MWH-Braz-FAM2G]QWD91663.1 fumarylacetoacetate hydrolase family protein [Polynucleobacter sp. MWH-Braz-FAM2G]